MQCSMDLEVKRSVSSGPAALFQQGPRVHCIGACMLCRWLQAPHQALSAAQCVLALSAAHLFTGTCGHDACMLRRWESA